jgi:hypothetical protein
MALLGRGLLFIIIITESIIHHDWKREESIMTRDINMQACPCPHHPFMYLPCT